MGGRTLAFGSLLAIAGITGYRLLKLLAVPSPNRVAEALKRIWAGSGLTLVVSFLTDIDASLGGAFGVALALGLLAGIKLPGRKPAAAPARPEPSSSTGFGAPPGTTRIPAQPLIPPGAGVLMG